MRQYGEIGSLRLFIDLVEVVATVDDDLPIVDAQAPSARPLAPTTLAMVAAKDGAVPKPRKIYPVSDKPIEFGVVFGRLSCRLNEAPV
jgi:hypothetical protein